MTEDRHEKNLTAVRRSEVVGLVEVLSDDIPHDVHDLIISLSGDENYLEGKILTKHQIAKLKRVIGTISGGYWKSSALICSAGCILKVRCPLAIVNSNDHGVIDWGMMPSATGQECPVEHRVIDDLTHQYVHAYAGRSGDDPVLVKNDPFIYSLIGELVETYVLEARINTKLSSEGGDLLSDQVGGLTESGELATHKVESPMFTAKMKLKKRRSELMKHLLLTPEMELKRKVAESASKGNDPASRAARLLSKAQQYMDAEIVEENTKTSPGEF